MQRVGYVPSVRSAYMHCDSDVLHSNEIVMYMCTAAVEITSLPNKVRASM